MITTIRRSGNSFIIRVPGEEMARLGIGVDDYVQVDVRAVDLTWRLPRDVQQVVENLVTKPEMADAFGRLGNA